MKENNSMKYYKNTTDFHIEENTAISLGKFDGIHRGHEYLLHSLFEQKKAGYKAVIFTFDIPPRQNNEQEVVKVLTTNSEKMHLFEEMGVDYLIECPFTKELMRMEPEEFIEMMVSKLSVKYFVVGTDFRFGRNRRGDYRMLQEYACAYGYAVKVVEKMKEDGRDISSTFVREELLAGNMEKVNHLLGYPYFICGEVLYGNQIGRTIGFPTANLIAEENKLLPPNGVYVTRTYVDGEIYGGITNIGCKPTIEGEYPIGVETHLFDVTKDLYGKEIKVEFLKRRRAEEKFENLEALKHQIQSDMEYGRQFLKNL